MIELHLSMFIPAGTADDITISIDVTYGLRDSNLSYHEIGGEIGGVDQVPREPSYNKIKKLLTNRFGSDIIEPSYIRMIGESVDANVILTDLKSYFRILKKRFELVFSDRAIELARKWTHHMLDNIVDDYQGDKLHVLLGYLIMNARIFGLIVDAEGYIQKLQEKDYDLVVMDGMSLEETEKECRKWYALLSDVTRNLYEPLNYTVS